jgi:hypothetical protein
MRMARREEALVVKLWQEMPSPEQIWQDLPEELKALLPEDWQVRKEWLFDIWTLQNGISVVISAFVQAVRQAEIDTQKLALSQPSVA